MECRAVVSSLSDYLDGRNIWASDDEVERIETHLTNCPTCLNLKLELSEIKNAARELPVHTPPLALWARISKAIEAEVPSENGPARETQNASGWWGRLNSRKFTFSLPQLAAAGAFVAILIVAGISGIFGANQAPLNFRTPEVGCCCPKKTRSKRTWSTVWTRSTRARRNGIRRGAPISNST